MDFEEYKCQIDKIERYCETKKQEISIQYAKENSDVEIGDVISDMCETILVDRISYTMSIGSGYPTCVYHGVRFTKKLVPYKSGDRSTVYQENMEKNHGRI